MIIILLISIGGFGLACFIIGLIQYIKNPKPPDGLTLAEYRHYYKNKEWLFDDDTELEDELHDINREERRLILDETILKYNRLLDNLTEQYKSTYSESEKSKILVKQVSVMERLNRALEKREKLD